MKKYCYTTLITTDNFIFGAIILNESLRRVNSKYPFICLVTENLSSEALSILNKAEINYKIVTTIETPKHILEYNLKTSSAAAGWVNTFTKFRAWQLTDYEKVIFLDADLLILKNLDHCFSYPDMTAALDGEYFNCWPNDPHFNSGFMVLKPSEQKFTALMDYLNNITDPSKVVNYLGEPMAIADQELLNKYYSDWPLQQEKHLNKYYNVFAPYILKNYEQDVMENAYFIHFVGAKPWAIDENGKPSICATAVGSILSLLPYAIAYSIMVYSTANNYKHIDWQQPEVFYKILSTNLFTFYNDPVNAKKFADLTADSDYKNTILQAVYSKDLREALLKLFTYYYNIKLFSGAYNQMILAGILANDEQLINDLANTVTEAVYNKFKRY